MSAEKYHVSLTEAEREELARWSKSQRHSERERKRARILLLADEAQENGAKADAEIAAQIKVCLPTVNRVRQRFSERGLDLSLRRKEQGKRKERLLDGDGEARLLDGDGEARLLDGDGEARLLDGDGEARLIALVCGAPPDGHKRWGLHLLKDTLIEQQVVDTISHEAVRQTLKKMNLSPG